MNKISNFPTNPLLAGMAKKANVAVTLNGAKSNASTLDPLLDYFSKGSSARSMSDADLIALFSKAFYADRLNAMKALFHSRDIRGNGAGERKSFRVLINWLATNYPDVVKNNLENIPFYGRWDDLYSVVSSPVKDDVYALFAAQLVADVNGVNDKKSISLMAKWLKSVNTSSSESRRLGRETAKALGLSPAKYRKVLSTLRQYLNVLETKLSAKQFDAIDYSVVPSKASLLYRKAFLKHDAERYKQYLTDVASGKTKINASTLFPYEIIRPIEMGRESNPVTLQTLDLQWKNQPNWLAGNEHKGLVMADTSGSMSGLPILVSVSLAIYFAERNTGPFKDCFLTFSNSPRLQIIRGNTIAEKVRGLDRTGWNMNTNLQAAFELMLNTAIQNRIEQKDMIDTLYIISDMQFDAAVSGNAYSNFEVIEKKYKAAGYVMPNIVFWNVNAIGKDSPVTFDQKGTCLVSGCSPAILKTVLSATSVTPIDVMMEALNSERYDRVVA